MADLLTPPVPPAGADPAPPPPDSTPPGKAVRGGLARNPVVVLLVGGVAGALIGLAIGSVAFSQSDEINQQQAQVAELEAELEDAQAVAATVTAANSARSAAEADLSDAQAEVSSLEDENAQLAAEVERLNKELDERASAPTVPNADLFEVSYGQWNGLFRISGLSLTYDYGWDTIGQIEYLGGGDCPLGYVEVEATYFTGNKISHTDYTNWDTLTKGVAQNLEIYGPESPKPTHVRLTMVDASCD